MSENFLMMCKKKDAKTFRPKNERKFIDDMLKKMLHKFFGLKMNENFLMIC